MLVQRQKLTDVHHASANIAIGHAGAYGGQIDSAEDTYNDLVVSDSRWRL
jgi:hypothetical protein